MNAEFYKPVEPFGIYPMPIPILLYKFSFHIFLCLCCVLFGLLIGFAINLYTKKRWKRTYTFNFIIPTIAVSSQVKCTDFRHKVHSDHVIDLRCSRR